MPKITLKSIFSDTEESSVVNEILGGFSLNKFKKIAQNKEDELQAVVDAIVYAQKYLPQIGRGSSHIVFALSGKTVLKIAWANGYDAFEKGLAQNEAEVDIFSNPQTKNVVAKIYDFSPDYYWLVSEVAKPFKSAEDFQKLAGISMYQFNSLLTTAETVRNDDGKTNIDIFEELKNKYLKLIQGYKLDLQLTKDNKGYYEEELATASNQNVIQNINKQIAICDNKISHTEKDIKETEEELSNLVNVVKNKSLLKFINDIVELSISQELIPQDITRADQLGTTADDRLVLLDYGFTEDVMTQYYSENIEKTRGSTIAPKINPAAGLATIIEAYQRARRRLLGQ